jgi:hypothetical protein
VNPVRGFDIPFWRKETLGLRARTLHESRRSRHNIFQQDEEQAEDLHGMHLLKSSETICILQRKLPVALVQVFNVRSLATWRLVQPNPAHDARNSS